MAHLTGALAADIVDGAVELPDIPMQLDQLAVSSAISARPGPRALQCAQDVPVLPAPPPAGAPPADFEVDLAHPEDMPDMVHRVDDMGHAMHIHVVRPNLAVLTLPEPLPLQDLLQARVQTIRHVPAALQQQVSSALAAAISRYTVDPPVCSPGFPQTSVKGHKGPWPLLARCGIGGSTP